MKAFDPAEVTPRFTTSDAMHMASRFFGVKATVARALPSERDQNVALTTDSGARYVLKIANAAEERGVLELQNAAVAHVRSRRSHLAVPELILSPEQSEIVTATDSAGRSFYVRLMTWVDGDTFVTVPVHDQDLLASLGTALAELDCALQDFEHPCMHRVLHWDLQHTALALEHLHLLPSVRQRLVLAVSSSWQQMSWTGLRKSVIHGDPNDYNVLVRNGRVAGFLDFGDLVHSAMACDLAIAMAYAVLDQPDPLASAAAIAAAYNRVLPLTAVEIDTLYPLMIARLCMSVCYSAHNAIAKSGDAYQMVTAAPAWALLERVADIHPESVAALIRVSCASASRSES